MSLIHLKSAARLFHRTLFYCCLAIPAPAIQASNTQITTQQPPAPLINLQDFQQLFETLEQHSQVLEADTENYIRCLEQNTQAESGKLPDPQPPEIITREWLSQLLNSLSAGVNSSETCQFLLDEILEKLPQLPPVETEPEQGV